MERNEVMVIIKSLRTWFSRLSPMIIALMANFFTSIFEFPINFIPDDKVYSVSLIIYSIAFTIIYHVIDGFLYRIESLKSIIKVDFSIKENYYSNQNEVLCHFNNGVARVFFRIRLIGIPNHFKDKELEIIFPVQVTLQKVEKYGKYYSLSSDRKRILININEVFNKEKKETIKDQIELACLVTKHLESVDSSTETRINEKRKSLSSPFIELQASKIKFTK